MYTIDQKRRAIDLLVSFETDHISLYDVANVLIQMEAEFGKERVDIVEDSLPADSFLVIARKIPLYG